jgi:hypothetical protein
MMTPALGAVLEAGIIRRLLVLLQVTDHAGQLAFSIVRSSKIRDFFAGCRTLSETSVFSIARHCDRIFISFS